ncbi:hypothetical protein LWI29_018322 [Acer saccharum]|uniref:P-type ATPase A domain-containing protein n=1 Tax=Acer saccharum TaxID=4024 RepID=A0AA39VJC8_ACESA|nr:hypothetical protein LWI29_018322 [Acer saccharum]
MGLDAVNREAVDLESKILNFLGFMWNPLSWVMEAAAIMAIALAHGGGKDPDYHDFVGIIIWLVINSTISFIEENNAGNAAAALMARLAPKAKLALTGGSLPVTKKPGDGVYSGSTCRQGEIEAIVIATGVHTFFGKTAHLVENTTYVQHFQKVLTAIGNFCSCSIALGMVIEIIVTYGIQQGISYWQTDTNKLTVDKNMIEVFAKGVDRDMVVLMDARASRLENQDAIDGAIVAMLSDPKEARAGIKEIHFLPFNPTDKRTALKYLDGAGKMQSKQRCTRAEIEQGVHAIIIDNFAERGLRSLAVAQLVPAGTKDTGGGGGPWEFVGLLHLFDRPRHDSAEMIRRALDLGVCVKMITGDHLAIGTIMIISKDRVKPSPLPDSWKLSEIFATKVVLGSYLALMTVVFFYAANETNFFTKHFHARVRDFNQHHFNMGWSFTERPGLLLVVAFIIAQLIATVISATTDWKFAGIKSIGWGWTGIIWLFNIVTYLALDPLKFAVRYAPSGRAWGLLVNRRVGLFSLQILSTALTDKKDFDKGAREVAWRT